MVNTWMVRAGQGSRYIESFRDDKIVAIGWSDVGDLSKCDSRTKMLDQVRTIYKSDSDFRDQWAVVSAGQLYRFAFEIKKNDRVVSYDGRSRSYICGNISGEYIYSPSTEVDSLRNRREVRWEFEKFRDELSERARNTLGSTLTLFAIPSDVSSELWNEPPQKLQPTDNINNLQDLGTNDEIVNNLGSSVATLNYEQINEQAAERIKDRIAKLSWDQMQELVAGILQAIGYKSRVSPAGSDRSRDVIASPDGFGLQEPRIVVEVKHRPREKIGADDLRTFMGGRRTYEKGLFVSTGGFTREAYYEAERSVIPLTLMDFEQLVDAVLINYNKFDERTKQLLPLATLYWPL